MLKLTRNLFLHDPDPAYMDYYEKGLYNQILGSRRDVDSDSSPTVTYHQDMYPGASRSRDYARYGTNGSCCTGTGLENHTKYQESIYTCSADGSALDVNLYIASTLNWVEEGFVIDQVTYYPAVGATTLRIVEGRGPLDIRLRVPGWVRRGFTVDVNGTRQQLTAAPGSYVTLSKDWQPGDRIDVAMPLSYRIERTPDNPAVQSIFYGPSLIVSLAGEQSPNSEAPLQQWRELTLYKNFKLDSDFGQAFTPTGTPPHVTSHGYTFRPFYIADPEPVPLRYHAYFRRVEPEIVFGSLGTGVPNDGIRDDAGLTFLDNVWEQAPFASHGQFVATVAQTADQFVAAGLFTADQKEIVVATAARARRELEP